MPLQHINDEILTLMKRRVTRKQIETLLEKLRKWVPGITLRTTMIAGSPGETDAQHQELVQFIKDFGFDMLGVFPYSPEPGTPMGRLPNQLPDEVKQARVDELMLAQQQVAFAKAKSLRGQTLDVLIDRPTSHDGDEWIARHPGQAPDIDSVTIVKAENLHPGQLIQAQVVGADGYDLFAELPKKKGRSLTVVR
jgi:ribosomal protein S12 methylthiotransferase